MHAEYERMKAGWGGTPAIRPLVRRRRNNASIVAAVASMRTASREFAALLAAEDDDLPRFYQRVKALAALPKAERDAALAAVSHAAAGGPVAAGERPRAVCPTGSKRRGFLAPPCSWKAKT